MLTQDRLQSISPDVAAAILAARELPFRYPVHDDELEDEEGEAPARAPTTPAERLALAEEMLRSDARGSITAIAQTCGLTTAQVRELAVSLACSADRPKDAWTPEDLDRVMALTEQGVARKEIARLTGRSKPAIEGLMYRIRRDGLWWRGSTPRAVVRRWSAAELKRLEALHAQGMIEREIARTLGRSRGSVAGKLNKLRGGY